MTPFMTQLLLALMALAALVLIVRVLARLWRLLAARFASRRSSAAASRSAAAPVAPPAPAKPAPLAAPVPAAAPVTYALPVDTWAARSAAESAAVLGPDGLPRLDPENIPISDSTDYTFGGATPLLAAMLPESVEKKQRLKRSLHNAGYFTPHAWQNLAATRYLGMIVPIILFGALLIVVPPQLEWPVMAALVVCPILGYALPGLLVQSQATSRLSNIEQAMPDMLDMLNMCVSQGMTLPQSLQRVGAELRGVYPDLAKELSIVSDQARIAGLPQALTTFAERVDLPDVHSFTSLLVQTEKMGTSVSAALIEYAENMRESLRQRADLNANSASFKLLFPTVLCLMPAVFLFLLGPAVVQLNDFFAKGGTARLRADSNAAISTDR